MIFKFVNVLEDESIWPEKVVESCGCGAPSMQKKPGVEGYRDKF
jgi:hypothetical protein